MFYCYIILRNPIERTWSGYWFHLLSRGGHNNSYNDIIEKMNIDLNIIKSSNRYFPYIYDMFDVLNKNEPNKLNVSILLSHYINYIYSNGFELIYKNAFSNNLINYYKMITSNNDISKIWTQS